MFGLTSTGNARERVKKRDSEMECYACGDKSHMAADCDLRLPATNDVEHMARIRRLVDAWVEGRITTQRKRQLVAGENRSYYGENCKPALTNLAFTKETA